MNTGKIGNEDFEKIILHQCGQPRTEVHCGPSFGVDVSVVNLPGGMAMAITSDPLSLIPSLGLQESAWLSVHLMANDMATTGIAPAYVQMVLNLPDTLSKQDFNTYWNFVHQYCKAIGVAITGGHTGKIEGQQSTIIGGGTMFLTAPAEKILLSSYARPGDLIIITKACALSSTAILAMSFPKTLINNLGMETYQHACDLFYQTSSLADALIATDHNEPTTGVTAMHDVTEGGVLGAVYEMAIASGNGVTIYNEALPLSNTVRQVCNLFEIDPRYCVGAGSMVIAVKEEYANSLLLKFQKNNLAATIIGKFTQKEDGYKLVENNIEGSLNYYPEDPYWKAFFTALKKGWK